MGRLRSSSLSEERDDFTLSGQRKTGRCNSEKTGRTSRWHPAAGQSSSARSAAARLRLCWTCRSGTLRWRVAGSRRWHRRSTRSNRQGLKASSTRESQSSYCFLFMYRNIKEQQSYRLLWLDLSLVLFLFHTWTSALLHSPALTKDLATQRAAYAPDRSTLE